MAPADPPTAVRTRLRSSHIDTVAGVLDAADAVAGRGVSSGGSWLQLKDGRPATTDRDALVPAFRAELEERSILETLPELLAAAVDAGGYSVTATPVPAPPYVTIASTGPVLRGTVPDGRFVISIDCFEVFRLSEADTPTNSGAADGDASGVAYVRTEADPAAALSVTFAGD